MTGRRPTIKALDLAGKARGILLDKKGESVVVLDVRGMSQVTDYYVIVSGNSPPHLKAMFNAVRTGLKPEGVYGHRATGDPESGWLVVDYIDVVIHILSAKARSFYAIEKLWAEAPRVD